MKFDIPEDWIRLAARREAEMPEISFSIRTNYRGVQAMKHTPEAMREMADRLRNAGNYRLPREAADMLREIADEREAEEKVSALKVTALDGKYGDVLRPFVTMMERELHTNAGKGDRPGWLTMDRKTALLEIFYHLAKLQKAVKDDNQDGIREYAADVANMSMMLVDVCGVLEIDVSVKP